MYKRNSQGWLKHIDFILWDVLALQFAYIAAFFVRHNFVLPYFSGSYRTLAFVFTVADVIVAALSNSMHNVIRRSYYQEFIQTLKQASLVMILMVLYMFSVHIGGAYSRATVYLTAVFHVAAGYSTRVIWKKCISHFGRVKPKTNMILVADEFQIPAIISNVRPEDEFEFAGLVLSNRDAVDEEICGIKVVANLSEAADYFCREWVDEVFIYPSHLADMETNSHEKKTTVATLIEQCIQMSIPIHIRILMLNIGGKSFIEKVDGYNVLTITSNYASPLQLAMKRILDIFGGLIGSFIAIVIMLVWGHSIKKESPGPILFKQTRVGQNGKKFQMYKIRSMYMDAEERKKDLMKNNRVQDGMMFKLDWDPRIIGNKIANGKQITGIGEFLRRNSLDEFPQFFNVLLGQMSIVGTRPPTVDEWEKYQYHHRARLATKPGITGMWQVSGRSKITDFEEVVRLDTEYLQRWSIGLDIKIIFKTIRAVLDRDGAM